MTTEIARAAPAPLEPTVFEGRVDDDAVAAFAAATNDHNPRYEEGTAVPPLFTGALGLGAQVEAHSVGVGESSVTGYTVGVHGQHDVYFLRPCRPGMRLRWTGATHCAYQTTGGVLICQRVLVTDAGGNALVDHLWSSFYAEGRIAREFGPRLPDHTFPEQARSKPVAQCSIPVDRDQSYRYAGVSGDHNGHCIDDEIAREQGYPGKILQGMCTFAMASGALVTTIAAGDPDRLWRLAVRFSSPARPCADLILKVYDAGSSPEGGSAYAFEVEQDGATVLKHGRAELRP